MHYYFEKQDYRKYYILSEYESNTIDFWWDVYSIRIDSNLLLPYSKSIQYYSTLFVNNTDEILSKIDQVLFRNQSYRALIRSFSNKLWTSHFNRIWTRVIWMKGKDAYHLASKVTLSTYFWSNLKLKTEICKSFVPVTN